MTKYDARMGLSYCPYGMINPMEDAILGSIFDEVTDADVEDILNLMAEERVFKKIAICKTLIYPLEYIINLVFAGKDYSKFVNTQQKLYWQLLRKKITTEDFKKKLLSISGEAHERKS